MLSKEFWIKFLMYGVSATIPLDAFRAFPSFTVWHLLFTWIGLSLAVSGYFAFADKKSK